MEMRSLLRTCATLIYVFLAAPILVVIGASLTAGNFVVFPPDGISAKWYHAALQDSSFMASLRLSLVEAVLVSIFTLLLVIPAVLSVTRSNLKGSGGVIALYRMPLNIPRVVLAGALLGLFTAISLRGTLLGLVLGHALISCPLAFWILLPAFGGHTIFIERAAIVLGASPVRAFMTTTLRIVAPAILGAAVFAFIVAFDDVPIALFLSGPTLLTLPVQIYTFVEQSLTPIVPAASSILILVVFVALFILDHTVGLARVFGVTR